MICGNCGGEKPGSDFVGKTKNERFVFCFDCRNDLNGHLRMCDRCGTRKHDEAFAPGCEWCKQCLKKGRLIELNKRRKNDNTKPQQVCDRCGHTKSVDKFPHHNGWCYSCKKKAQRQKDARRQRAEEDRS